MDRRTFLWIGGQGVGLACLGPVLGCSTGRGSRGTETEGFDPGPYTVGDEHLVFDAKGSAYVLDDDAHQVLKLGADAEVASRSGELGLGAGQLNQPIDALVGPGEELFVLDRGNGRVQVFDAKGAPVRVVADDLNLPRDMALHDGHLYVSDTLNHRVRVFTLDGGSPRSLGEAGEGDRGGLNGPCGIAVAPGGDVHVLDCGDGHVHVFSPDGEAVRTYSGYGDRPGKMLGPRSIAISDDGHVFIADPSAGLVHVFEEDGRFVGRFRPRRNSGVPANPMRLAFMPGGRLYIWTGGHDAHESV